MVVGAPLLPQITVAWENTEEVQQPPQLKPNPQERPIVALHNFIIKPIKVATLATIILII